MSAALALLVVAALAPCQQRAAAAGEPLVVGDSVTVATAGLLERRGFGVDARVCRQVGEGLAVLARRRPTVGVLALGANGRVTSQQLLAARRLVRRRLVLVTPSGPDDGDRGRMLRFRQALPRSVGIVDWAVISRGRGRLLPDGVHPTPAGARALAAAIDREA